MRGQIDNILHTQKILFILCGQIEINLHTQKILFIRLKLFAHGNLRVQVISYLPQVGQIISYLPTQNKYYFLRVQIISYLPTQK